MLNLPSAFTTRNHPNRAMYELLGRVFQAVAMLQTVSLAGQELPQPAPSPGSPQTGHTLTQPAESINRDEFLERAQRMRDRALLQINPRPDRPVPAKPVVPYSWHTSIVTALFSIGAQSGRNSDSAWDPMWQTHYGGFDNPNRKVRAGFVPSKFIPQLNPFYVALPYNDITSGGTKPEARKIIPWFGSTFHSDGVSVCKDRWLAVRKGDRVCYAQWCDCGPFRSDFWQYVFGTERPQANALKGAGLMVSPAVREYLGLDLLDVTDWKFAETTEVPRGPWALYGVNNPLAGQHPIKAKVQE